MGFSSAGNLLIRGKGILTDLTNKTSSSLWIQYFIFTNLSSIMALTFLQLGMLLASGARITVYLPIILLVFLLNIYVNYKYTLNVLHRKGCGKHSFKLWLVTTIPTIISGLTVILRALNMINDPLTYISLVISSVITVSIAIYSIIASANLPNLLTVLGGAVEALYNVPSRRDKTVPSIRKSQNKKLHSSKEIGFFFKDFREFRQPGVTQFLIRVFLGYVAAASTMIISFNVFHNIKNQSAIYEISIFSVLLVIIAVSSRAIPSHEGTLIYLLHDRLILQSLIFEKSILLLLFCLPFLLLVILLAILFDISTVNLLVVSLTFIFWGSFSFTLGDLLFPKFWDAKDSTLPSTPALVFSVSIYLILSGVLLWGITNSSWFQYGLLVFATLTFLLQGLLISQLKLFPGEM